MKVAIVHNQLSSGGGMEAYLIALIRGFAAAGDEVHIHTYEVDKKLAPTLPCIVHKTNLFFLPSRWKKYYFLRQCNRFFKRTDYDLSLTLTRTYGPQVAVIGGIHPASMNTRSGPNHPLRCLHDRIEIGFEQAMLLRTKKIVTHSKGLANEIANYYPAICPEKISVFYPPVDTTFFVRLEKEKLIQAKATYNIAKEKLTLLFPSTGHRRKGLKELLIAFSRLDPKRFELLVAGEPVRSFTPTLEHVRYLGYITNLSALYSAVDYTVLPARYEPFGLVVAESLHCGTPVVVTRSAGVAELLTEQEGVVIDNNHPDTLEAIISQLQRKRVAPGFLEQHNLNVSDHIALLKKLLYRGASQ
ncbi:MAG: glycosyltransferase [Candidatus Electrothrix sp. AU1_5]|nr:glycosyltransferase [Candidatus Electrothrix sp. AX1]MCI5182172.1 glycosyltransferase [Candidatus Electrothrix gigas]MCI5193296.1 glycosyltransferase [Candidatus Electrothrix gigas]